MLEALPKEQLVNRKSVKARILMELKVYWVAGVRIRINSLLLCAPKF